MKPVYSSLAVVFLLLVAVSATTPNCPVSADHRQGLLSDSVGLNAQRNNDNNEQKLVYSYVFDDSFNSVPDVAIGLNQISSASSPYLQLIISNARTTKDGIYFQAQSNAESKWENFKINFVASDREDIELGTATVYNPAQNPLQSLELKYPIAKNFGDESIKIKTFLHGVSIESTDQQQIGITQNTTVVSSHTLYFSFSSVQRTSIIHQISISVIIYNINTPGVLYADGIIDQNYVVSKTQITIPRHGINELRTYMVGINSFQTSAAQPISISAAIDETFRLIIGPIDRNEINFISVSYLILSIIDCGSCNGYPLLFDGICNVNCPQGTKEVNGVCVPVDCKDGYWLVDGDCIPQCGMNEYYDKATGRCFCKDGFYYIDGMCQACQPDEYFNYRQVKCVPYCTYNSYFNVLDRKCYCNQGYYLVDGICQQCRYGSTYNPALQKCVDICLENEIYSPNGCICRNGYYRIEGTCQRCPYGLIWNPQIGRCGCYRGEQLLDGNVCKPYCKINEERVGYYCQCKRGFEWINGKCDKCPANSYYDFLTESCPCVYGYTLVKGKCMIVCPPHQYLDPKTNLCIDYCKGWGEIYVNGECVCAQDFERLNGECVPECGPLKYRNSLNQCVCFDGYWKNPYGECRPINCPPGTYWNATMEDCISNCGAFEIFINGACVCQFGYKKDNIYGKCLPDCLPTQVRVNGFCECAPRHRTLPGGYCILDCAPGSTNINGVCVCRENCGDKAGTYCPYGQTYDPILRQCRCKSPKIWFQGQCVQHHTCGLNEYWCGSYCACKNGFYRINGTCTVVPTQPECPYNSVFNGVNCQCNDGFYPVTPGVCLQCPPGTFWIGTRCDVDFCDPGFIYDPVTNRCFPEKPLCDHNEYYTGVNCRCKQGYFWIEHKCQRCPSGTFFDGYRCSPGTGPRCPEPFQFYNGDECVCIPGYHPLANGKCVSCPDNTYWDGVCCKPQPGVHFPLTTV